MHFSEFSFILKPSPVGGIGVFATHDICAGTAITFFPGYEYFTQFKAKIKDIPEEYHKYLIYINEEECYRPEKFDRMEIGWYINHSDHPNTKNIENQWVVVRHIKAGDEIFLDYNGFGEPNGMKESYYS